MKIIFLILYNVLIYPIIFFAFLLSPFNRKIKEGIIGRFKSLKHLKRFNISTFKKRYWFHVASHGEFQQIETLIDSLKKDNSSIGIVVSFFSPSGFNNVDNQNIDCKVYLPFDFPITIFRALRLVNPDKIFFTSNDFWPNFMIFSHRKKIELILTSARLNDGKDFNSFVKNLYQRIFFNMFDSIFTITKNDQKTIAALSSSPKVIFAGNPRMDRILKNISHEHINKEDRLNNKVLVLASIWEEDNNILFPGIFEYLDKNKQNKIIIVPHEINDKNISFYCSMLDSQSISYKIIDSYCNIFNLDERVIVVNKVGFLSKIYSQTFLTYIGGGFSKNGIHNLAEPAAAGNPVIFGPNFQNSNKLDAVFLKSSNAGFSVNSYKELIKNIDNLYDMNFYRQCSKNAKNYVIKHKGSTQKIIELL
jgi:3-deoxy-D-manno-octulosonic-acid transferase